jgi:hypothetical protein
VVFLKDISSFFILTISLEYKNSEELVLKNLEFTNRKVILFFIIIID